jgi:dethiobiotin synthetase
MMGDAGPGGLAHMASGVPGVFVTGTDVGVGKTTIAGGLATLWRSAGRRVGVFKPISTGCTWRVRLGLVSDDVECLAYCSGSDLPLDTINPIRYRHAVDPIVAAQHAKRPIDFEAIRRAYEQVCYKADVIVIEGWGGLLSPIAIGRTVADLAVEFGLGVLIISHADLGAAGQVMLSIEAVRARGLAVAGVVLNGYNPQSPSLAEESNPATIAECARIAPPTVVPIDPENDVKAGRIGPKVIDALSRLHLKLAARRRGGLAGG